MAREIGEFAHTRPWDKNVLLDPTMKFKCDIRLPDLFIFFNTLDTVLDTHAAVRDAMSLLIPSIGVVDSNCNPNGITYLIPGNDDSLSSYEFFANCFKEAIRVGKERRQVDLV